MANLSPTRGLERSIVSAAARSGGVTGSVPGGVPNSTSSCSLCSDHTSASPSQLLDQRKGQKRRKHCGVKCRKGRSDEAHWSKLLQTCQAPVLSPPPVTSPPISPIAAFGQSVTRFFKWISPNKRASRKNSLEESDRPTSVSSEDSGVCPESPVPKSFAATNNTAHNMNSSQNKLTVPVGRPIAMVGSDKSNCAQTILQTPSSSALLTKRLHEKLHRVYKPTPVNPSSVSSNTLQVTSTLNKNPKQTTSSPSLTVSPAHPQPAAQSGGGHSPLESTTSCPPLQHKKLANSESSKRHLADTWPPINYHFEYDDDNDEVFDGQSDDNSVKEVKNLEEFTIPHENVHTDELIGRWRLGNVYRGRWHGLVMIQSYEGQGETIEREFWEEVKQMSRVRHENIALFMGACTATGHLALVTSVCNGVSLYEKLHITRERVTLAVRLNLSYQIAQAIAYLHAKKIVYRNLASKNIYIEKHKVTLSVINFSNLKKPAISSGADTSRSQLPYLAPELLTHLISSTQSDPRLPHTPQTDIYAFGILLHELLSGTKPFDNIPKEPLVLQVCNGRRPLADRLACPQTLKSLMESCWAHLSHHRSHIHEILKELQKKDVALHNRFSSSEPDSINKMMATSIF